MNREGLNSSLKRSANRHIFNRFRVHIRFYATAVYLLFGIFDYFYAPEHMPTWISLRLAFVFSVIVLFEFAKRLKVIRSRMSALAVLTLALSCWPIVVMIAQSGGYLSLYSAGLILCGTTGLQIFRLRKRAAVVALSLSFAPAVLVYLDSAAAETLHLAIIQAGFLLGMIVLSYIYGASEEQVDSWWIKFKKLTRDELDRLHQTEILKNHFPKVVRDSFEKNPSTIYQKKILPNAVVGFADIVSSSQISNEVPLVIDWELKERFLEAATQRAIASEMVVLTHLGDGFLFLANYNESSQWYYNLISFYEGLVGDFRRISMNLNLSSTGIETGVKFGVSSGSVMVGFLGKHQSYFTAIGPDVNLAARLCGIAKTDQIVVSSRVWHSIKPLLIGWDFEAQTYDSIKGFDYNIAAVHVSPRSVPNHAMLCALCSKPMSLVKTAEGFLDYRCSDGHNIPRVAARAA